MKCKETTKSLKRSEITTQKIKNKNHKKLRSLKRKKKKRKKNPPIIKYFVLLCIKSKDFNLVLLRFKINKYAAATNVLLHP